MKKSINLSLLIIFLIIISIQHPPKIGLAQEGETIEVISTDIENNFPNGLTFQISVQSEKPITRIKLYYRFQGSISTNSQPIEFDSAEYVNASYTWDTSGRTIAPSTPITYYWQITDQDGNKLTTPETQIYYDDNRFNWQELSSPEIILRWYEGDEEFGQDIFIVAEEALAQMKNQTNRQLDFPIFILLYANEDDFISWHFYVEDWVGGQAFPSLGVTAQIVPTTTRQGWIENVIPHEIAHLFFYQIINTDTNSWPSWLNEGFAQYYEFSSNDAALERVTQAAQNGDLLPLVLISGSFGSDPERAYLAYDESYSVVVYITESWGNDGIQNLVSSFQKGKAYREAIEDAFGITWEEFEAGWITWMGVPATPAPPPTSTPTFVYLKAPEGWPTPTKVQKAISTNTPTKAIATKLPPPSTLVTIPASTEENPNLDISASVPISCIGGVIGFFSLFILFLIIFQQIRKQEK